MPTSIPDPALSRAGWSAAPAIRPIANTLVTSGNRIFRRMIRKIRAYARRRISGRRGRGLQEGYVLKRRVIMLAQVEVRSLHPEFEERTKPLRDGFLTLIPVHASHIGLSTV